MSVPTSCHFKGNILLMGNTAWLFPLLSASLVRCRTGQGTGQVPPRATFRAVRRRSDPDCGWVAQRANLTHGRERGQWGQPGHRGVTCTLPLGTARPPWQGAAPAGSCRAGGVPEGTARLHLHPNTHRAVEPPTLRQQCQQGWREINRRRGPFPTGHSVPPPLASLSPPGSPSVMEGPAPGAGWPGASAASTASARVTLISQTRSIAKGDAPPAQRIPQPPLISSQRLIGTFLPGWGLCQGGNLGAAGSRGPPCPRWGQSGDRLG